MSVIRLLLDEDVRSTLAEALRARGYDAVAVADLEMQGAKDPDLIDWAREERRVILSHNVRDFPSLAASEVPHAGIVVSKQADFKTLLRRILRLLARKQAEDVSSRPIVHHV
jgi:uncharacterized protein with PIN domain